MKNLPQLLLVFFSLVVFPSLKSQVQCHDLGGLEFSYDVCLAKRIIVLQGVCCCIPVKYTMENYDGPQLPMCDSVPTSHRLDNPHYFAFVADGSAPFSVTINPILETCFQGALPSPHNTIQGALIDLDDCDVNSPISESCGDGCGPGPFTLTTPFIPYPGQVIGIVVDGCGPVICDFTIEIHSGWTNNNFMDPPIEELVLLTKVLDDGTLGCKEMTFSLSAGIDRVCDFLWTLPDGSTIATKETSITVNVDDFPDGYVCVQGFNDLCFPGNLYPSDPSGTSLCLPFKREDPIVELAGQHTTCDDDNGAAFMVYSNAQAPYTYQWSTGETTSIIENLSPGTYSLTIIDGKGCEAINTVEILPSNPLSTSAQVIPTGCDNKSGRITVNGIGGSGIYNYFWAHDVTPDNTLIELATGVYQVTVVDIYDTECFEVVSITVGLVNDLELIIIDTTSTECAENNGSVTFTANLSGNYNYTILGPGGPYTGNVGTTVPSGWTVGGLPPGDYTIRISDSTGALCGTMPQSFTIGGKVGPLITAGPDKVLCGVLNSNLEGTLSDGTSMWSQVSGPGTTTFSNAANPVTNISVSTYGTYVYRLTGILDDCEGTPDEVTVIFNSTPLLLAEEICDGENLIISVTISDGTPPYSLDPGSTISGDFTGNIFTSNPVSGGVNYAMQVVDDRGCESSLENFSHRGLPELSVAEDMIVLGCGDPSNGQIIVSVNGSISPNPDDFDFNWSLGSSTTNIMNFDVSGNYVLEVTDETTGCASTVGVEVIIDQELPEVNAGANVDLLCSSGTITLNSTTNITGGIYEWSGVGIIGSTTGSSIEVDEPGIYEVKITNPISGCENSDVVEVIDQRIIPHVEVGEDLVLDCGVLNGELPIIGSSNTAGVTFSWSTVDGTIVGNSNAAEILVSEAGTYILTVRDPVNGCEDSASIVVTSDVDEPEVNVPGTLVINCYNENEGVEIEAVTSIGGLEFLWTTSGGGTVGGPNDVSRIRALTPGIYSVVVNNPENGCSTDVQVVVTADLVDPDVNAGPDATIDCANLNAILSGSTSVGNVSYQWTTIGGAIDPPTNTQTVRVVSDGTYILTVTNLDNGCTAQDELTVVSLDELPDVSVSANNIPFYCTSDIITINATSSVSGVEYSWSTQSGGGIVGGVNSSALQVNGPGQYRVTVLDPTSNCTRSLDVNVIDERVAPNVNAGEDLILDCSDEGIKVITGSSSTPNVSYEWTNSSMEIVGTSASITVSEPGVYTLTVTNNINGCTSTSQMELIPDEDIPQLSIPSELVINCYNQDSGIELVASSTTGGVIFEWSTGEMGSSTTVMTPGSYEVTVTNPENGCSSLGQVMVTGDFVEPDVNAGADETIDCGNLTAILSGSSSISNSSYQWTTIGGAINPPTNSQTVTVISDGVYILTVTNLDNGCSAQDELTVVSLDELPDVSVAANNIPFYCTSDIITINATSSVPGVTYSWSVQSGGGIVGGVNDSDLEVNGPGQYRVTVLDPSTNCTRSMDVSVVDERIEPNANAGEDLILDCSDGGIKQITGSSSTPNVSYEWTNSAMQVVGTSATITVNGPGVYTLTVTNNINGCTSTSQMELIPDEDIPQLSIPSELIINCYNRDSGVALEASSTTGGVEFEWSTGAIGTTTTVMSPGTYEVTVTNSENGCSNVGQVVVTADLIEPDVSAGEDAVVDCVDTQATLSGSTNVMNGQYMWSAEGGGSLTPPLNMPTVIATRAGTYRLTITNPANGCSASDAVSVTSSVEIPVVTVDELIILGCGEFSSEFVEGSSSIGGVDFTWTVVSGGGTFGSDPNSSGVLITSPGVYELAARDPSTGCEGFAEVEVIMTDDLPVANAGADQELTCETKSIILSGAGSTGNNLTYLWESVDMGTSIPNPTQRDVSISNAGTFRLTVTNQGNGCSDNDIVIIYAEEDVLSNFFVDEQDITCTDDNNGRLAITDIIGGVPPINIFFDGVDVDFQHTFNRLSEGEYEIKVVDSKGCERTKSFIITNPSLMRVNLGTDVTIKEGEFLDLEAIVIGRDFTTQPVSIVWDTLDVEFGIDNRIVKISPSRSMTVGVTVTDENGCVARTTIYVTVIRDVHIFVPNVFSPNRDGRNDFLIIHAGEDVVRINAFIIYDRWGNLLYEEKNFDPGEKTKGWDGTFVGKRVQTGVYVYYLAVTLSDGTVHQQTGDVTVLY